MFKQKIKLSDLQISVMQVLWDLGKASPTKTKETLAVRGRDLALTTVATLLKRLEDQELVQREKDGRQYLYSALISRSEVRNSMLSGLMKSLFNDNASELVHHLVNQEDVKQDDLDRIKKLLNEN